MQRLSLIQLSAFASNWKRLKLTDDDLRALESAILADPGGPPVMKGTGGLRKIRFSPASSSGGKSGGARACYAYFPEFGLIYLCAVFPKSAKVNLTDAEAAAYKMLLQRFAHYLRLNLGGKGITP
jgi:hypothetical protein